jgi:hypothetical protein
MSLSMLAYWPQLAFASLDQFSSRFADARRTVNLDVEPHSYKDITT